MQIIIVLCVVAFRCILTVCSPGLYDDNHFKGAEGERKVDNLQFSAGLNNLKFRTKRIIYQTDSDIYDDDEYKFDEGVKKMKTEGEHIEYIEKRNVAEEQQHTETLARALKLGDDNDEVEYGDEMDGNKRSVYDFHGSFMKFRTNVARFSNFMTHSETDDNGDYEDRVENDTGFDRKRLLNGW